MNVLARFVALAAFSLSSLAAGCNNQSEGQRCDQASDCQSGLDCKKLTNQPTMVCCPINGASSVASCNPGSAPADTGSDAAGDAPDTEAPSQDATPDAAAETTVPDEAAADAAAE